MAKVEEFVANIFIIPSRMSCNLYLGPKYFTYNFCNPDFCFFFLGLHVSGNDANCPFLNEKRFLNVGRVAH